MLRWRNMIQNEIDCVAIDQTRAPPPNLSGWIFDLGIGLPIHFQEHYLKFEAYISVT